MNGVCHVNYNWIKAQFQIASSKAFRSMTIRRRDSVFETCVAEQRFCKIMNVLFLNDDLHLVFIDFQLYVFP